MKTLYLTFDDGPSPGSTEKVLNLLERKNAGATFFVVAERALREPAMIAEIRARGHAIGNHSLDHRYAAYFRGTAAMRDWVRRSEDILAALTGAPTVGFRPPAGVRTPELKKVLNELKIPMILWNWRFFDKAIPWSTRRAKSCVNRARAGDIVILHDQVRAKRLDGFLGTLECFIDEASERGFRFAPLTRDVAVASR